MNANQSPVDFLDRDSPPEERLPDEFVAHFRGDGRTIQFEIDNIGTLGDPLTDARKVADGYRFHDVMHLAFAVHLGWSPVLRRLLGRKRRSDADKDECEDGGRACMVEEAICHVVHMHAESPAAPSQVGEIDLSFVAYVQSLARGFEVEACTLSQWERAIVDGLDVFRSLRDRGGGSVRVDRRLGAISLLD